MHVMPYINIKEFLILSSDFKLQVDICCASNLESIASNKIYNVIFGYGLIFYGM